MGPSLGHSYLGDLERAAIGMGVRVGGMAAGALVGYIVNASAPDEDPFFTPGAGPFLLISGLGLVIGSVYSFAALPASARERGPTVSPGVDRLSGKLMLALRLDL